MALRKTKCPEMIKLSLGRTRDVAVVASVRLKRRSAGSLFSAPLTEYLLLTTAYSDRGGTCRSTSYRSK